MRLAARARLTGIATSICLMAASPVALAASAAASESGSPRACGSWVVDPSPSVPGPVSTLLGSVDARSPSDVWAVGHTASEHSLVGTVAEHWDGAQWSLVPTIDVPGALWSVLYDVGVVSATDAWAVGTFATPGLNSPLIEHWDGTAWSEVAGPDGDGSQLYGVSALASDDVWAVGYPYALGGTSPLIEHWDGVAWSIVPTSPLNDYVYLTDVVALGPEDVWGVGSVGIGPDQRVAIMHWDGLEWTLVPAITPRGTWATLDGIAAAAPDDVWAAGWFTNADNQWESLVEHWDGVTWVRVSTPKLRGQGSQLGGVSAVSSDDAWAVGFAAEFNDTLVQHWDGSTWSRVQSPNPARRQDVLGAVDALADGHAWAVGYGLTTNNHGRSLIESFCP